MSESPTAPKENRLPLIASWRSCTAAGLPQRKLPNGNMAFMLIGWLVRAPSPIISRAGRSWIPAASAPSARPPAKPTAAATHRRAPAPSEIKKAGNRNAQA